MLAVMVVFFGQILSCDDPEMQDYPTCQMGIFEGNFISAPRGSVQWINNAKVPGDFHPSQGDEVLMATIDGWQDQHPGWAQNDDLNTPRVFTPTSGGYRGEKQNLSVMMNPVTGQSVGGNYPGGPEWDGEPFIVDPNDYRYGMTGFEGNGAEVTMNLQVVNEGGLTPQENLDTVYQALQQAEEDGILRGANADEVQTAVANALTGSWNSLDHLTPAEVQQSVINGVGAVMQNLASFGHLPKAQDIGTSVAASLSATALGLKSDTITALAQANANAMSAELQAQTTALLTGVGELPTLEELEAMHNRVQVEYGEDLQAQTDALMFGIGELPTLEELEGMHETIGDWTAQQTADYIDEYFGQRQLSAPEIAQQIAQEIDALSDLKPPTAEEIATANAAEMGQNIDTEGVAAGVQEGINRWAQAMGEAFAELEAAKNREAMGENITQAEVVEALSGVVDEQAQANAAEIAEALGENATAQEIAAANFAAMGPNLSPEQFQQGMEDLQDSIESMGPNPTGSEIASAIENAIGRNLTQEEVREAVRGGTGDALQEFFGEGVGELSAVDGPNETIEERLDGVWDSLRDDERLGLIQDRFSTLWEPIRGAFLGTPEQNIYWDFELDIPGSSQSVYRIYFTPLTDTPWGQAFEWGRLLIRTFLALVLTIYFIKRLEMIFERNG